MKNQDKPLKSDRCYIEGCDWIHSEDAMASKHKDRRKLRLSEKYQRFSCWLHERGYYLNENPST